MLHEDSDCTVVIAIVCWQHKPVQILTLVVVLRLLVDRHCLSIQFSCDWQYSHSWMAHKDSYLNNMIAVMQRHYVKHGSERWACPTLPAPSPWSALQYYISASDWWPWIVSSVTVIADTIKHANDERFLTLSPLLQKLERSLGMRLHLGVQNTAYMLYTCCFKDHTLINSKIVHIPL